MTADAKLLAWLEERRENCALIAEGKIGADRAGWLEDERYFKAAIEALGKTPYVGVPAGWKLVPIEPTNEMMYRGREAQKSWMTIEETSERLYKAMLAAAPPCEPQQGNG